jgi:2-hydroxy-3-oxopropionate reductase
MGKPMAGNLLKGGVELLVYDINPKAVEEVKDLGGKPATLAEISACDVVFIIVPNGAITQEILFGADGIAPKLSPGALVIDMSSVTPDESRVCFAKLAERNIGFLDAPVSGGEPGAINGTLAFMAGGEQKDFDRAMPYFEIMGSTAVLIGSSGAGSVTKLCNQIIVNMNIATVAEAMTLATKAGVDPELVYMAIRGGLAGSAVLDAKAPMMIARNFKPGGKISINHKDIKNVMQTAHSLDVPLLFTSALYEVMQALKVGGHMDDDHAGIVQFIEALADVKVSKPSDRGA